MNNKSRFRWVEREKKATSNFEIEQKGANKQKVLKAGGEKKTLEGSVFF